MLEQYFVKPATIDRLRGSWIAPQIEQYLAWLVERGYSARFVWTRVPIAFAFGEFAQARGAREVGDLPGHVDAFVAERIARHQARTGSSRPMSNGRSPGTRSTRSWPASIAAPRPAGATTRSCCCWSPTVCAAVRSPRLTLDDIDWKRERLAIPERKAGHSTAFPLSPVVGEAILDYLQHGRPETSDRHVFFRAVAPLRPIGPAAVSLARPPLPAPGRRPGPAARVAHAAPLGRATARRRGPRLKTIGDFVGHRSPRSTEIYAKVAVEALRRGRARRRRGGAAMTDDLTTAVTDFLAHKRALGRKYHTEEATLRLLVAFADQHRRRAACTSSRRRCWTSSSAPGPGHAAAQLQPPPRRDRLLPGLGVVQQRLPSRRCTHPTARDGPSGCRSCSIRPRPGGCWTPPPRCPTTRGRPARTDLPLHLRALLRARAARRRGLRAAAGRRRRGPAARWSCAAASSARAAWSRTDHASARCSASRSTGADRPARRGSRRTAVHLRRPALRAPRHAPARRSITWSPLWLPGPRRRLAAAPALPASLVRGRLPAALVSGRARPGRRGSTSSRRSWATSTRPRPRST